MSVSTAGFEVRSGSRPLREAVELVSSMRFSISLLTLICIASVIGTVVTQAEPYTNYVNQFGPFWAEVFAAVNLYTVYSAWWFLLILAFLVVSTSLCIARNAPKILVDLRTFKENIREQSLAAFHHKGQGELAAPVNEPLARIGAVLGRGGWKCRVQQREAGTMVAARKGTSNKLGYLAAHSSIVLICLGGLFDGNLVVKAQMALQGKTVYTGGSGLIRDIGEDHRLSASTPTFRANILVPEGAAGNTAVIQSPDGVVLQELPFDIRLKKFIVDYYATGMPKLFASEIVIRDHETGEMRDAVVKVNEPAFHRGVAIYQSSFDDGGSHVKLRALPLGGGKPFEVEGQIGSSVELNGGAEGKEKLTLEFSGLRVINVENFGAASAAAGGTDVRSVDLVSSLQEHLGSGAKSRAGKELRNIGPSVSYKLRDASGQAREFNNYMLPVELDGQRVFLAGVRDSPSDNFRYLRIPADDRDSLDSWVRLREALGDEALREEAVHRYVAIAAPAGNADMPAQLSATARQGLAIFAGALPPVEAGRPASGLQGLASFLEVKVPEDERERISEVLLRIVNGSLFELLNITREKAGLERLEPSDTTHAFMTQSVLSLSDSYFYPAPMLFELDDFKQVQASVFQVARAPGKTLVYLGSILLIVGVFAMLYIRERRMWIWLQPAGAGSTRVSLAMSTTRRTLDTDAEFDRLQRAILERPA